MDKKEDNIREKLVEILTHLKHVANRLETIKKEINIIE